MERLFRAFPDRLIKERRLAGIRTREATNRFLQRDLPTYHRRFRRTLRQDNTLPGAGKGYVVTEAWRIRRPQPGTIVETLNGQRRICHGAPPRGLPGSVPRSLLRRRHASPGRVGTERSSSRRRISRGAAIAACGRDGRGNSSNTAR